MSGRGSSAVSRILTMLLAVVVTAGLVVATRSPQAVALGEIPEQEWGSAEGRGHSVSADKTDAGSAKAHTSTPAEGAGPDERHSDPGLRRSPLRRTTVDVGSEAAEADAGNSTEATGFVEGTSRVLAREGGPKTRVYANPDGTRTLRTYETRRFFRDDKGKWSRIDSTLVANDKKWRTKADSRAKRFAKVANPGQMISVELGGKDTFGFGVADAKPVRGTVEGSSVTYADIRTDADLNVQAVPAGMKETIVLKSREAPTVWNFPLRLQGLTARMHEGTVQLVGADGAVRGVIPPGFMEDSNVDPHSGEGARSTEMSYELVGDGKNRVLRLSVDKEWLAAPEREFPVKVDPTVNKGSNGSTYVLSPYDSDYSGDPNMSVGTYNGGANIAASYMKFDAVSSELSGQYVLGAKLHMFETWSYSCDPRNVSVHAVTEPWTVGGNKTWPGPGHGGAIANRSFAYGHSDACGSRWVGMDLGNAGRDLVHGWTHGQPNHGLTVRASSTDSYGWKKFASAVSANPPYLSVTYTPYWARYDVGSMTDTVTTTDDGRMRVTVTNDGKETWTSTNSYKLGYRIWDANGTELDAGEWSAWTQMPHDVAPGQSATIDARIKSIPPGTYTIRWDMDKYGMTRFSWEGVPMSDPVQFTIPNQTPVVDSASPPSDFTSSTLTPTLSLKGHDRDAYPGKGLRYNFKVCDSSGSGCTESGWQDSPRWAVPEGTLAWSQDYTWQGRITDTTDPTPWTRAAHLSTRVPQPAITSHLASTGENGGVDPGVGNFSTPVTDASVTTPGPALQVRRTYNSLDPRQRLAFGSGWATRWDTRLIPDDDGSGNVVVTYPDGHQSRFGRNPGGDYVAPAGESSALVTVDGGGWKLRVKNGTRYTFDAGGKLTEITEPPNRVQRLEYNADGRLVTVTDVTSGRALSFTWAGGHVTEVGTGTDPVLTWTYGYNGDRLTKVCDPTGACTNHTYGTGSHYRTVTLDANPQAYWRLADEAGSTSAASAVPGFFNDLTGSAHDVTFGGQAGPLAGSPTTAGEFNGTSSYVQLPDDLVRNNAYATVELWFKTSSTEGGVLFSTSNGTPGDSSPGGSMPVLYVGTDGKLHGHFWNGQVDGMASAGAVNDGTWHHVALTGADDTQSLYLDGNKIGTQAGKIINIDPHNYLGTGAVNGRNWPAEPAGTWSHFPGAIAEAAFYRRPLGASVVAEHHGARTAADQLTNITRPGGVVAAELAYNDVTDRVTSYTDDNGGTRKISAPTVEGDGFRYGSRVRATSPNAYWRLDETKGTTANGDPRLRRAAYHRGDGGRTAGPFPDSSARRFDGSADYVRLPENAIRGQKAMSVELWFKTSSTEGGVLFSTSPNTPSDSTPGSSMPVLYVGTDGKLHGHFWNEQVDGMTSLLAVNDGAWHHVALTGAKDTQSLYLDGSKVGTLSGEIRQLDPRHFVGTGAITRDWPASPTGPWSYFDGAIAQFGLYQRTLSDADVSNHYGARGSEEAYLDAVRKNSPHTLWGLEEDDKAKYAAPNRGMGSATYHDVTLKSGSPMRGAGAAKFDGSSGYVRLPDDRTRGRTRLAVELWFKTSSTEGGVLFSTSTSTPADSTPGGSMPVLYVGTDGKLHGHFWNGKTAGIATESTVNDGEWHHVVLSGNDDRQWLYLDGEKSGTASGEINNLDPNHFVGVGAVNSLDWPAKPAGAWSHFTGSIGEVALYHRPLTSAAVSAHYSASVAGTAVRMTDPAGGESVFTYDPTRGGRPVSVTGPSGGTKVFAYDSNGFVRKVTDENGNATTYVNDERGNQRSITRCRDDGGSCYTTYRSYFVNSNDPLDPRNDSVTFVRDGRSASRSDDRYATRYVLSGYGQLSEIRTPGATGGMERITHRGYTSGAEAAPGGGTQPPDLLASIERPDGAVTTYDYTSAGDLARVTDPAGKVTDYTYDELGRVISKTVTSAELPNGATTTYRYDGASRLVEKVGPATTNAVTGTQHRKRTHYTYNPDGTVAEKTVDDSRGNDLARTTGYTYDQHGRVHTVTGPEGGVTTKEYDAFGAVVRKKNPVGTEFTYTYTDSRHQLATRTVKGFTGDGEAARDVVLESRAYDPAGRLASVTDAMGRTTEYTYYDDDLLASERLVGYTDPETGKDREVSLNSYTYTGTGEVATHTYGEGRYSTTTEYDPANRPVRRVDRENDTVLRSEETTYDVVDNAVRVVGHDADGTVHSDVEYGYDPMGRETSRTVHTGSQDLVTRTDRDEAGLVRSVVDPRGTAANAEAAAFTTAYDYDAAGRPTTEIEPEVPVESQGGTATTTRPRTTIGYNTFGDSVDVRDPRGAVTHTTYDKAGRPVKVRMPDYTPPGASEPIVATRSVSYDAAGRVISTVNATGHETTYGYDELGNLRRRTDPASLSGEAGGTWIATYDPLGERLSTSDPTGAQTQATYDDLGRRITSTVVERVPDPTRNLTTRYTHDELGNVASVTTPGGRVSTKTYDDLGNVTSATDGAGNTTTRSYDGAGRPVSKTGPTGKVTKYDHDLAGRLLSMTETGSEGKQKSTREFGYDRAGNRTSITDPLGVTTTHEFDALNRLRRTTRPVSDTESITTSWGYDAAGNITRATDGNGSDTVFTINEWGKRESVIEPATERSPNQADRTYTTVYDRAGRVSQLRKPGGVTIANSYDPLGNLTRQVATGAAATTPDRVFTYDAVGRRISASAPGGKNTYSYDDRDNLVSASGPSGDATFTYNADGLRVSATTAAGKSTYSYDGAGRLVTATDALTGTTVGYSYDKAGRLTQADYGTAKASRAYGYDGLGRLTSDTVSAPDGTETASVNYEWDAKGQLVGETVTGMSGSGQHSYAYDQAGRLVSADDGSGAHTYDWDAAGNLVQDGAQTAVFNERNRLLSKGGTSYTYTPRGTLSSRTTDGQTTQVSYNAFDELVSDGGTGYSYDGLNRLVEAGGTSVRYAGTGIDVVAAGQDRYTYTSGGSPLGVSSGGKSGIAWSDQHGDLVGVVDPATGNLAGSRAYGPFGSVNDGAGVRPALGFQHQYTDSGSGMVNMAARWYQPGTGTFASRDTAELDPRDLSNGNRYAYAGGSPLVHADRSGKLVPVAGALIWAVVGIAARAALRAASRWAIRDLRKGTNSSLYKYGFSPFFKILGFAAKLKGHIDRNRTRKPPFWDTCSLGKPQCLHGGGGSSYYDYNVSVPDYDYGDSNGDSNGYSNGYSDGYSDGGGDGRGSGSGGGLTAAQRAWLAHQRFLERRRQRVIDDANTPHPRPATSKTIADKISDAREAAENAEPIELGTLYPDGHGEVYQPDRLRGLTGQPAPLTSVRGHLNGACVRGDHAESSESTAALSRCGGTGGLPGAAVDLPTPEPAQPGDAGNDMRVFSGPARPRTYFADASGGVLPGRGSPELTITFGRIGS